MVALKAVPRRPAAVVLKLALLPKCHCACSDQASPNIETNIATHKWYYN